MPLTLTICDNEANARTLRAIELTVRYKKLIKEMRLFAGEQAGGSDWEIQQAVVKIANEELVDLAIRSLPD